MIRINSQLLWHLKFPSREGTDNEAYSGVVRGVPLRISLVKCFWTFFINRHWNTPLPAPRLWQADLAWCIARCAFMCTCPLSRGCE